MMTFTTTLRRLVLRLAIFTLFFAAIGTAQAQLTNNVYVSAVPLDGDRNVELSPGEPIRYTVFYGREAGNPGPHARQEVRVSVYLSTDGNPTNLDNFLLDFFDDVFLDGISIAEPRTQTLINRIPSNFTGTFFLIAHVTVTAGAADTRASDNFPSVTTTGAARVTIRPFDSPTTSRVSLSSAGVESNELSESPSVSADGRYIVFQSEATNLIAGRTAPSGISQIYLRDTLTNEVQLISQLGGVYGNAESKFPVISSLGAPDPIAGTPKYYVAYQSAASNLVTGTGATDTNQQTDIFLYDLSTGVTTLVSVPTGSPAGQQGNGGSFLPSISGDGNLIAFESRASNLLGRSSNGIFLDTNGRSDVFVYNRTTKAVTAASASSAGVLGNGDSTQARISEDGSTVVFRSYAGNLGVGAVAPLPRSEILAKTLAAGLSTGRIDRISVIRELPGAPARSFTALDRDSFDPAVSRDGRFVAFASRATNTQAPNGDSNTSGNSQVYVVNRAVTPPGGGLLTPTDFDALGNTSLNLVSASVSPLDPLSGFADNESVAPVISGDGRYIGFRTEAGDLLPNDIVTSDGRVFQTKSSGVVLVFPNNTDVIVDTPTVDISDSTGSGASAYAVVTNGAVSSIVVTDGGSGYTTTANSVTVDIADGGGSGARAVATVGTVNGVAGVITEINVTRGGSGYARGTGVFTDGVGTGCVATAVLDGTGGVKDVRVSSVGFGYTASNTSIVFSAPDAPGGGVEPTAVAVIENGRIYDIAVLTAGSGYVTTPTVSIISTPLIPASVEISFANGEIVSPVTVLDSGSGYTNAPSLRIDVEDSNGLVSYPADVNDNTEPQHTVFVSDGLPANAISRFADYNNSSDVYIRDTGIKTIIVTEGGSGYTQNLLLGSVEISGGGGSLAQALAIVENGSITRIDIINTGSGYLSEPTVVLPAPGSGGVQAVARAILVVGADRVTLNNFGLETTGLIGGFEVPSSRSIAMSSNGRYMLFTSEAANNGGFVFGKSNQRPLDSNQKRDVFLVDRKINQAVTPVRGTAPTVTLTVETRDLTFNSTRVISASAFDGGDVTINGDEQTAKDGVIKTVEIYANNVIIARNSLVGTTSTLVLDATFTAPQLAGPTQIYAVATDGNGNRSFSAPAIIQILAPTTQKPSVALAADSTVISVGGSVNLTASVSDPENQIAAVSFYSNGLLLNTDVLAPFQYNYTPTSSADYKLTAVVVDGPVVLDIAGLPSVRRNDSISNELVLRVLPPPSPNINISSPNSLVSNASVGQPVFLEIAATSTNPSASISSVVVKDNGTVLPGAATRQGVTSNYRYTWIPTSAGAHTITATATDSQQGFAESSARQFNVNALVGIAPTVAITSPASGSPTILTQNTIPFRLTASDLDGSVTSAVIYGNGARLGNATFNSTSGFWELNYDASLLSPALYDFVAIVVDNQGNYVASSTRSLSVAVSAPEVSILTPVVPVGGVVVDTKRGQPLTIIVQALSRDSLSRISSVTLSANGVVIGQGQRVGSSDQYSFTWVPDTTGVFQIIATAADTKSGSAQTLELPVRVTEPTGNAPTVSVQAPPTGLDTNSIYVFRADAADTDGTIESVEFFLNGLNLGQGSFSVASGVWIAPRTGVSSFVPGVNTVSAVAVDNSGNRSSSVVLSFDVTSSAVNAIFGNTLNDVFFSVLGRNATVTEQQTYFALLGQGAEDYEIAAVLMQSTPFDSTGANVINAYRAVFGEYPTYTAYQNGLIAINGGISAYIDSLYASGEYLAKFGPLPSFSVLKNRETFSSTVHTNLTGSQPSSKIKGTALSASSLNLTAAQLAAARLEGSSEKSLVTAAFANLTSQSAGSVVATYVLSLSGTTEIPTALLLRARVAGVILALTEPATPLSFRETEGLRGFALLDVAELYGTGTTDAAIKPIFRTLPASSLVALGSELKFTATVISPAVFTSDISTKWSFNSKTTLTVGSNSTSSPPEHIVSFTIPAAASGNAGSYTLSVSNRSGTVSAPPVTARITPLVPAALPGTVALKVGVFYSVDLGANISGMSYVVKGLPRGLALNVATGVISGTPTRAGSYSITYSTKLGKLTSVTQRSTFIVAP